jgi:hypothetical protein
MLTLFLMIAALVLLILAAFNVPSSRVNLGWLGLACWCLAVLLAGRRSKHHGLTSRSTRGKAGRAGCALAHSIQRDNLRRMNFQTDIRSMRSMRS